MICLEAKAELVFAGSVPTRFWMPDLEGAGRRDYFLQPGDIGDAATDYVYAQLDLALDYCAKSADCRVVAPELRADLDKGCTQPPMVYEPWVVFRYNGDVSPLYPSGPVFLCRSDDQLLMVFLAPVSLTLDGGEIPDRALLDSFDVAVFPRPE